MTAFVTAFLYALHNIKSNFFHTVLSVLGIIIGVAALLSMLSMIDGLEKYANEQINKTTSIKVVELSTKRVQFMDGMQVPVDHPKRLQKKDFQEIVSTTPGIGDHYMMASTNRTFLFDTTTGAAVVYYATQGFPQKYELNTGTVYHDEALPEEKSGLINSHLAGNLTKTSGGYADLLNKTILLGEDSFRIQGIVSSPTPRPEIILPIQYLDQSGLENLYPFIVLEGKQVEDVIPIKEALQKWITEKGFSDQDFSVISQDFRVGQAAKGFALFRLIMGLIIGISVVVGGVGVMNVLLISVTQRTHEIGLRKAVGAKKKDVYIQFLTEAMIVSVFGTLIGMVFGIVFTLLVSPIVHSMMDMDFSPVFSGQTMLIIALISLIIGVIFGTFPAVKASRLNPIEALRRE